MTDFNSSSQKEHFKTFANQLESVIARYGETKDITVRQKRQVERLIAQETEFRKTLTALPEGMDVYRDFIHYISKVRGNILTARPFFRERQEIFTACISTALKAGNPEALAEHRFNYQFVAFVMRSRPWDKTSKIFKLARAIEKSRNELVEMNMPLAISRARIFWNRTQKSHLEYMDLVQIAAEGLMSAVDKFVPPYTPVFRGVAIGRMVGNFIENYSETVVHFYPTDKRKIYRANKAVGRLKGNVDFEKIAVQVNYMADDKHKTTPEEIASLMGAASCVSADAASNNKGEDGGELGANTLLDRFASLPDQQPDRMVESSEAMSAMFHAAKSLTTWERKLLRLKGIDFAAA